MEYRIPGRMTENTNKSPVDNEYTDCSSHLIIRSDLKKVERKKVLERLGSASSWSLDKEVQKCITDKRFHFPPTPFFFPTCWTPWNHGRPGWSQTACSTYDAIKPFCQQYRRICTCSASISVSRKHFLSPLIVDGTVCLYAQEQ